MYRRAKRFLDTIIALCMLVILIIPMIIEALCIKMTSNGPVFFAQKRYGINSKIFTMYKFRSMRVDTPEISNQEFKNIGDYVTPVGRFLRKTSLDELPQLWNIVKGEMSIIGPRPLSDSDLYVVKLREKNGANLVRPGITGLAQINGRNNISDGTKAALDNAYANHITLLGDLTILLRTVLNVLMVKDINKDIEDDVNNDINNL